MGWLKNIVKSVAPALPAVGAAAGWALGPAGSVAAPLIGGMIGSGLGEMYGAEEANSANAAQAQANREFQLDASNTAHQREVLDLKRAGLNPLLSANAGASTPSGAQAQMTNTMAGQAQNAGAIANMVLASQKQKADIATADASRRLMDAQTIKTGVDTAVNRAGLPEAEIKNDVFNWFKNQYKEINQNSAKPPKNQPSGLELLDPRPMFRRP